MFGKTEKFGLNFSYSVQFVDSSYKLLKPLIIYITVTYFNMIIPKDANNKMNDKDSTLIKNATKKQKKKKRL